MKLDSHTNITIFLPGLGLRPSFALSGLRISDRHQISNVAHLLPQVSSVFMLLGCPIPRISTTTLKTRACVRTRRREANVSLVTTVLPDLQNLLLARRECSVAHLVREALGMLGKLMQIYRCCRIGQGLICSVSSVP